MFLRKRKQALTQEEQANLVEARRLHWKRFRMEATDTLIVAAIILFITIVSGGR